MYTIALSRYGSSTRDKGVCVCEGAYAADQGLHSFEQIVLFVLSDTPQFNFTSDQGHC